MKQKLIFAFLVVCLFVTGMIYLRRSRPSYESFLAAGSRGTGTHLTKEQALSKKTDQYKMCMTIYYQWVLNLQQVYFSWCTHENGCFSKGPSGTEARIFRGNFSIRDPKECIEKMEEVSKLKPHAEKLEKAAKPYAETLKELSSLLNGTSSSLGLSTYYQDRLDQKDQGSYGRKQHPQLLKAFHQFFEASKNLDENIDEADEQLQEAELAKQKKRAETSGKWLSFLTLQIRYQAKAILNQTLSIQKNPDIFSAKLKSYEQSILALVQYQSKIPPQILSRIRPILERGQNFLERAKEWQPSAKQSIEKTNSQALNWLVDQYLELMKGLDTINLENDY